MPTPDGKKINDIVIRMPTTYEEKMWYSYVAGRIAEVRYGKLNVELTLKDGRVTFIREHAEKTFNIDAGH